MFEYILKFYAPQYINEYGTLVFISCTRAGANDINELDAIMDYYSVNNMGMTIFDVYGQAHSATKAQIEDSYGNCISSYAYIADMQSWLITQ